MLARSFKLLSLLLSCRVSCICFIPGSKRVGPAPLCLQKSSSWCSTDALSSFFIELMTSHTLLSCLEFAPNMSGTSSTIMVWRRRQQFFWCTIGIEQSPFCSQCKHQCVLSADCTRHLACDQRPGRGCKGAKVPGAVQALGAPSHHQRERRHDSAAKLH